MTELEQINTAESEDRIIKLLVKKETYFLNGSWGSGKTELLNRIKRKKPPFSIINIELWEIKDSRNVMEIAFSRLFTSLYWLLKIIVILSVLVSILMTPVINLGLSKYISQSWYLVCGVVALSVTVWQVLKYKSEYLYSLCFRWLPLGRKVLLIDDFDRIHPETQQDLFKLFNILKGRLPILFIGDFSKVQHSKGEYLHKIIDKRLELPMILHPKYIWNSYFNDIAMKMGVEISFKFRNIFVKELRNLRDRKQFNDLVIQEFYQHGKYSHVQIEQQLSLIYLYQFYPDKYQFLKNGGRLEYSSGYTKNSISIEGIAQIDNNSKTVTDVLAEIIHEDNANYPASFSKSRQAYLLYESVSNLSEKEAFEVLNDGDKLVKMIRELDEQFEDFYHFITANYKNLGVIKEKLVDKALEAIGQNYTGSLINYLINVKDDEIMPTSKLLFESNGIKASSIPEEWNDRSTEEIQIYKRKHWENLLENHGYDFSQKLYFFENHLGTSYIKLGMEFENLDLDSKEFLNGKRKDVYFLTFLTTKNLWYDLRTWDESIWSRTNILTDKEFLSVLIANSIITSQKLPIHSFNSLSNKDFTVNNSISSREHPYNQIDNSKEIKKFIMPRLSKMKGNGYSFYIK